MEAAAAAAAAEKEKEKALKEQQQQQQNAKSQPSQVTSLPSSSSAVSADGSKPTAGPKQ